MMLVWCLEFKDNSGIFRLFRSILCCVIVLDREQLNLHDNMKSQI